MYTSSSSSSSSLSAGSSANPPLANPEPPSIDNYVVLQVSQSALLSYHDIYIYPYPAINCAVLHVLTQSTCFLIVLYIIYGHML